MRCEAASILALVLLAVPAFSQASHATSYSSLFVSEASALVSDYIPASAYSQLTASVAAAATAASVTGDPGSLLFSALLDVTPPPWFSSAIPTDFQSNVVALEEAIASLRNTTLPASQTTVITTTTNSIGSIVTTNFVSNLGPSSTTVLATDTTKVSKGDAAAVATAVGLGRQAVWAGLVGLAAAL